MRIVRSGSRPGHPGPGGNAEITAKRTNPQEQSAKIYDDKGKAERIIPHADDLLRANRKCRPLCRSGITERLTG